MYYEPKWKSLKIFLKVIISSFLLSTIQFQYNCVTCILSKRCKQAWVVPQGMALLRVKKVKRKGWTLKNHSKLLFVERGLEVNEKKSNLHLMQIYTKIGVQDSPNHILMKYIYTSFPLGWKTALQITNPYFFMTEKNSYEYQKRQERMLLFTFRY